MSERLKAQSHISLSKDLNTYTVWYKEMYTIILGKAMNYLTTQLQAHSNPAEKTWMIM